MRYLIRVKSKLAWFPLAALIASAIASSKAFAQQIPAGITPEQAGVILEQRPDLGNQLRERLLNSGLSPNEVRARLRAAGFPSNFLDDYLSQSDEAAPTPGEDVLNALAILGVPELFEDELPFVAAAAAPPVEDEVGVGVSLFGLSVFRQATTQFVPIVSGPVDANYRLGPGDVLVLLLTGEVELSYQLEINREGFIFIPQVGQVFVNNLTMEQLRQVLYTRLGRAYSGIRRDNRGTTRVDVTVANVRVNSVRVLGEVMRPGTYTVPAMATVLSALYEAGGPRSGGNFRTVHVRRGGELVASVDLYDYLLRGEVPEDARLQAGDVIFVPIRGTRVTIVGEIKRPAVYELAPGEALRELIAAAGGLTAEAYLDNASIARILPPQERREAGRNRTVLSVNLNDLMVPGAAAFPLEDADSITVFSIRGPRRNAVTIRGSVWQPAIYNLGAGMKLSDLLDLSGGLRPEAYRGRVQISRMRPDSSRFLVAVALPTNSTSVAEEDPELHEFDEITIFSIPNFRPERTVTVHGAVRSPGTLAFTDSLTLRDVIMLAGGLTDAAYLEAVQISRLPQSPDPDAESLATLVSVPLDSSYVVDTSGYVTRSVGSNNSPDVYLQPYDNVFVRRQPGWELQRNVTILGEVRFPGKYTLLSETDRLSDIIGRAGGLKPQAYANGIRFFRSRGNVGRISVDLPRVLEDPSFGENLILASGDSIFVPRYIPIVRVEGAVHSPTNVSFVRGRDVNYYVRSAGGYTDDADKGDTFVQQPNGLIQDRGNRPEPGAVIVVPTKERGEGINLAVLFGGIAQILSAVTTIVIVLR